MSIADYSPAEFVWLGIGLSGQALFSARFLVQWLASERARRSTIPIAFWYFSIAGGLTLFCYALKQGDPVFILGQGAGVFIYARNLYLIHVERRAALSEGDGQAKTNRQP